MFNLMILFNYKTNKLNNNNNWLGCYLGYRQNQSAVSSEVWKFIGLKFDLIRVILEMFLEASPPKILKFDTHVDMVPQMFLIGHFPQDTSNLIWIGQSI